MCVQIKSRIVSYIKVYGSFIRRINLMDVSVYANVYVSDDYEYYE